MRTGWQTRTIEEVCEIVNGGTPKTGVRDYWDGGHQWVTPAEMGKRRSPFIAKTERTLTEAGIANSSARPLPPMSVILSSRAPIGHLVINTEPMSFNQGCKGLIPKSCIHYKYLYYFLIANTELLNSLGTGATFKELSGGKLKSVHIPVPPLEEQERIVAILDEAFEGVAKANANVERNLANARELTRALVDARLLKVSTSTPSVELDTLRADGRVITYGVIKLGDHKDDGVPCLRTSNVRWLHIETEGMKRISPDLSRQYSRTILRGGEVLVNVRGTLGGVSVAGSDMVGWNISREVAMVPTDIQRVHPPYLAHWIARSESQTWLHGMQTGATYTGINLGDLRTLPVCLPPLDEQRNLSQEIDEIVAQARSLFESYQTKSASLDALKQSLLHNAFSGELTSAKERQPVVEVGKVENTASPEYTADVLAFAYAKHRAAQRDRTFGRVKGQKVLHLVEAVAGVDLGRDPIKDAAGPNDSAHMRRVEDWAAQQYYFAFEARGTGGYDFIPGSSFEKTLASAYARLSSHKDAIAKIIDLLVPMDSQEAEVLATVHAAWNNLIIDGVEPTRDAIVAEARENWTASKLEIPVVKFEKAIRVIRQSDIIPDGSAKPVRRRQESLF